jgi:hypothetical protein
MFLIHNILSFFLVKQILTSLIRVSGNYISHFIQIWNNAFLFLYPLFRLAECVRAGLENLLVGFSTTAGKKRYLRKFGKIEVSRRGKWSLRRSEKRCKPLDDKVSTAKMREIQISSEVKLQIYRKKPRFSSRSNQASKGTTVQTRLYLKIHWEKQNFFRICF